MKGGNHLVLAAIRQPARAGIKTRLPVTVLFTTDEESGFPGGRWGLGTRDVLWGLKSVAR